MQIATLTNNHRPQVDAHIRVEWGGPLVVSRGNAVDTRTLPGLVAVERGDLLGYVLYEVRGDACEIVVLHSLRENRGAGAALIQAVKAIAQDAGCKRLWLVTTNDNTHAIRFYQRRGFSLRAVHLNAMDKVREYKPHVPLTGIDDIPLLHEFEFEIQL